MPQKTLTLEEYKEIGTEMAFLENRLTTLYVKVANKSGVNKASTKQLKAAQRSFGSARSNLEAAMLTAYPGADLNVFFGNTSLPADIKLIEK